MEREQEILAFLKALFAGEPLEGLTFTRLPAEKSLQVLVYYYCRKQLPEDCRETAQKAYYSFAISEMRRRATGEKIRSVLDEAGIPFYFLKGCELAYAYYPDPALRFSIDVDFLTGENDALPAFQRLIDNGWQPLHKFYEIGERHLPDLVRKNFCAIEVHRNLFRSDPGENRRLMEILQEDPHSPELLLVHLMYHAFRQHHWHNAMKTVIDVGMVLRKATVDPDKYRALAVEFGAEGLLEAVLASFPEIYPETWRQMFPCQRLDDDTRMAIRAFALQPEILRQRHSSRERLFLAHRPDFRGFVGRQLKSLTPSMLGVIYHLSPTGSALCYPFLLVHYLISRSLGFALLLLRGRRLQQSDFGRMLLALNKLKSPGGK